MYKTHFKSRIITKAETIQPDGFSGIEIVNIGTDNAIINDNIQLAQDASWSWTNDPCVVVDMPINIRFAAANSNKVLVQMFYFKKK